KAGKTELSGDDLFRLYDTYGFPVDLSEDFAREQQFSVDRVGFEQAMEQQRSRARSARQEVDSMKTQGGILADIKVKSEFVGYNDLVTRATVVTLIVDNQMVDFVAEGQQCQ